MKYYLYILPGLSILVFSFQKVKSQSPIIPHSKNAFVVIAHRGDHTKAPENTFAAYHNAIVAGADYVEIDLRTSKDSQLVIMHDVTLNRMTNGNGNINNSTWSELQQLKVIDKNNPGWPEQSIPLFSDVLKFCKGKINIYLDFKDADVKKTFDEIEKAGMQNSVIVYINAAHQFVEWKNIAPQIPLMVSLPDTIKTVSQLNNFFHQYKISILDGSYNEYSNDMVSAAIANLIPVWPDIQSKDESPVLWDKALTKGFTGLQTDHPEALILYLKSKNFR